MALLSQAFLGFLRSGELNSSMFVWPVPPPPPSCCFAPHPPPIGCQPSKQLQLQSPLPLLLQRAAGYLITSSRTASASASAGLQAHGPLPIHSLWRASRLPPSSPTFAGLADAGCTSSPWPSSSFISKITTSVSSAPLSACCPANQSLSSGEKARLCVEHLAGLYAVTR